MTWVVCPSSNLVSCSQKCRKLVGGREKQKAMCRLISRVGKRWNPSQWAVCFNDWTKVWLPFIAPLRPLAKWAQQYLGSEPLDVSCCCNLEWCFPTCWFIPGTHKRTCIYCWQHGCHDGPSSWFCRCHTEPFTQRNGWLFIPSPLKPLGQHMTMSVSVEPESNRNPRDFTV